mgnify:CR=1 FL=1
MNRRQFLSSVAGLGVSAALPAKAVPISGEWIEGQRTVLTLAKYSKTIRPPSQTMIDMFVKTNELLGHIEWTNLPGLDSRRGPWQDDDAGAVPVVE